MPLDDIKDAGILASFTRWGWPWHGVIKGGYVGATGQPHPQPLDSLANGNNVSWLIDTGLPAISLTPDEASFYAGLNMEWRNYALIAGGYAYGTYIGDQAFIYMDPAGDAWRIMLAYAFPGSNVLRITATIQRFGDLRVDGEFGVPIPVVQTLDVACHCIELSPAPPGASGAYPYLSRYAEIQDVHTNGSKVLIGVFLRAGYGVDSNGFSLYNDDMFSLIELVPSGQGSSISVAASETINNTVLTPGASSTVNQHIAATFATKPGYFTDNGSTVCPPDTNIVTVTAVTIPWDYGTNYLQDSTQSTLHTRYAYYDQAGAAHFVSIAYEYSTIANHSVVSEWTLTGGSASASVCTCAEWLGGGTPPPKCYPAAQFTGVMRYATTNTISHKIFDNGALQDEIGWTYTETTNRTFLYDTSVMSGTTTDAVSSSLTKAGTLQGYIADSSIGYPNPVPYHIEQITNAFRSYRNQFMSGNVTFSGSTRYIGLHKMASKAVAFYGGDGSTASYGPVSTPLGTLPAGLSPGVSVNFAYQRKTGAHTFDTVPICYV